MGDMKEVQDSGPTNATCQHIKVIRPTNVAPWTCAALL
jgi:hypothetical protein